MNRLVSLLEGHSLVVSNNGVTQVFDGRGISDLYRLLTTSQLLAGATIADKVVGKGAAALMILGGVKRVHALTISRPALTLFANSNVSVTCDVIVDGIINRTGTGPCPVENLCADCTTAAQCLPLITSFINSQITNKQS